MYSHRLQVNKLTNENQFERTQKCIWGTKYNIQLINAQLLSKMSSVRELQAKYLKQMNTLVSYLEGRMKNTPVH